MYLCSIYGDIERFMCGTHLCVVPTSHITKLTKKKAFKMTNNDFITTGSHYIIRFW